MKDYREYLQPEVVSRLASLELRARMVVEGFITGLHKSPYHGFSVEFAEHRQYMPGDEIRYIDWKVYGRTNRYYIKQEYENAIPIFRRLLLASRDPDRDDERADKLYESLRGMHGKLVPSGSDVKALVRVAERLYSDPRSTPEQRKRASEDFEVYCRDLATQIQVAAQQKDDKKLHSEAADAYAAYLSLFKVEKWRPVMEKNYAVSLLAAGRFVEAGEQYEKLALMVDKPAEAKPAEAKDGKPAEAKPAAKPAEPLPDREELLYTAVGAYASQVAEHAVGLLIAGIRGFNQYARAWSWDPHDGPDLAGSTVAVIGAGGIGREVIKRLEPFDVRIIAVTRSGRDGTIPVERVGEVWGQADHFVLCAPATDETQHLIGAPDRYIARQFQAQALKLGIFGGIVGLACGAGTVLGIDRLLSFAARQSLAPGMTSGAGLSFDFRLLPWQWIVLALLPVVVAIVAMMTARITVLRSLARMP